MLRISCGFLAALATATAFAPVSSAIRSRADDTAGAVAPRRGIIPSAAVMQAMVLAVPMTPHVPIYMLTVSMVISSFILGWTYRRSKLFINGRNLLDINLARSEGRPIVAAVGACTDSLATMTSRHHRTGNQREDRFIGRDATHQLRGNCLVTS